MICTPTDFGNGMTGFVCSSGTRKRCKCGRVATLLCDWKVGSGTCDKPICEGCAIQPAPGKDLCHEHTKAFKEWKAKR